VVPAPGVHADLAAAAALAVADEHRPGAGLEVVLGEGERLGDAQPGAPEQHDQRPHAGAMDPVAGLAHDGDDLLDRGRIGRVAQSLVARRASGEVAGQGDRRAAATGGVQQQRCGHGLSSVDDEAAANYTQRAVSPQALKARCGRRLPVLLQLHKFSSDPADGWGRRTPAVPPVRDRPRSSEHVSRSAGAVSV
jgi:hypothetical protein